MKSKMFWAKNGEKIKIIFFNKDIFSKYYLLLHLLVKKGKDVCYVFIYHYISRIVRTEGTIL